MSVRDILSVAGLLIGALYFILFFRTFVKVGRAEADRFIATFAKRKRYNLVLVLLIVAALSIPNAIIATVLAVAALGWGIHETRLQDRQMRDLAFDPVFVRQLFRTSFLVPVAIACLLASKFLPNSHGAS